LGSFHGAGIRFFPFCTLDAGRQRLSDTARGAATSLHAFFFLWQASGPVLSVSDVTTVPAPSIAIGAASGAPWPYIGCFYRNIGLSAAR